MCLYSNGSKPAVSILLPLNYLPKKKTLTHKNVVLGGYTVSVQAALNSTTDRKPYITSVCIYCLHECDEAV